MLKRIDLGFYSSHAWVQTFSSGSTADAVKPCHCRCKGDDSLSTEGGGYLGTYRVPTKRRMIPQMLLYWLTPCATFRLHGARGVRRGGGRNILPSAPVAAKKTSAGGGGIGVSSQGEALEEAAVRTVGERGGRPGPHPKPSKGWGPSGTCMRRVPLGLVGCLGRGRGKTEGGAGGR